MKIKIIKCNKSTYWYTDKIGKIFESEGLNGQYYCNSPYCNDISLIVFNPDEPDITHYIDLDDYIILQDDTRLENHIQQLEECIKQLEEQIKEFQQRVYISYPMICPNHHPSYYYPSYHQQTFTCSSSRIK